MKYMNYTQTITLRTEQPDVIQAMLAEWDRQQATADIMGYIGTHLLADRDEPGRYIIVAEFAVVDPDVSAADEAARNNERPETQAWAARLLEVVDGEPVYRHYDELYRTG
jgi:heme-degrading monooxygenase HmoA